MDIRDAFSIQGFYRLLMLIYTAYGFLVFSLLFILFLPLLAVPIVFKRRHNLTGKFNRWWARALFILIGIPFRVDNRTKLDPKGQYVFCPNHFSYLDIPALGLNHHDAIFIGKSSLSSVPVFGWMYSKLHITVDRDKLRSKYGVLALAHQAIDSGKSLVVFVEGGIRSTQIPYMATLKDGAFRIAIEKQIPIVPVSIPDNWIILPEDDLLLRWRPMRVIFHAPIPTNGMDLKDIPKLKEQVTEIIHEEMRKSLPFVQTISAS